jgi:hypothetical protein
MGISRLHALEEIHRAGWLQLSMKSSNFCVGGTQETRHKVYILDFGRAEKYLVDGGVHRPPKKESDKYDAGHHLSCNQDFTASGRDDIINLGYVLMHVDGCNSPWKKAGVGKKQWLDGAKIDIRISRHRGKIGHGS